MIITLNDFKKKISALLLKIISRKLFLRFNFILIFTILFLAFQSFRSFAFVLERYDPVNFAIACDYFHWNNPNVSFRVDLVPALNNFTTDETKQSLITAYADWNNISTSLFRISFLSDFADYAQSANSLDHVNSIHVIQTGWNTSRNALAVTWLTSTTSECAADTDVVINNQYFDFCAEEIGKTCLNTYDVISVIRHEFGHVAGLDHPSTTSSLMYASLGRDSIKHVATDDARGVTCLYPSVGAAVDSSTPECLYEENHTFTDTIGLGGRDNYFGGDLTGNQFSNFWGCASVVNSRNNSQIYSFLIFLFMIFLVFISFKLYFCLYRLRAQLKGKAKFKVFSNKNTFNLFIIFFLVGLSSQSFAGPNIKFAGGFLFNTQKDFNQIIADLHTKSSTLYVDEFKNSIGFKLSNVFGEIYGGLEGGISTEYMFQKISGADSKYSIEAKASGIWPSLLFIYYYKMFYVSTNLGPMIASGYYKTTNVSSKVVSQSSFSGFQMAYSLSVGSDIPIVDNFFLNFEGGYKLAAVNYLKYGNSDEGLKGRVSLVSLDRTSNTKTTSNMSLSFTGSYIVLGLGWNF